MSLRKHAYSNILKISPPKTENFQRKNSDIFSYFCSKHRLWVLVRTASARRYEYSHSMFLSRNKKHNLCFRAEIRNYIKMGFKGVKIIRYVFVMCRKANRKAQKFYPL